MRKKTNYWTKEKCKEEALKYNGRAEFKKKSGGAYNASIKNGWLDELCEKMFYVGNRFKRCVYIYEFCDKSVYVGLTYNIEERDRKHKRAKDSMVFRYIQKTGFIPKLTHTDYMEVDDAKLKEGVIVENFRNNGYKILNVSKTGGVGGGYLKWTFEKCKEEALKYNSRKEFVINNNSAYNSAKRYGWLNIVCSHMNTKERKHKGYWTKEKCKEEALKYELRNKLYKGSPGAYMAMLKNNWLEQICFSMKTKSKNGYWTFEKCKEEALKYSTKKDFRINSNKVYSESCRKGWMIEICQHMNHKK